MGYVGNEPLELYVSKEKQTLTGNGTVGPYTLNNAVSSPNDIEVFVNNVRQEPSIAYTVSGTSLTMTGVVTASDDFYLVYDALAQGTTAPAAGSVTQAMLAPSVTLGAGYFLGENGTAGDTTNGLGDIFRVHEEQLDTNVTIAANTNAAAVGPLILNATVTVNGALTIV